MKNPLDTLYGGIQQILIALFTHILIQAENVYKPFFCHLIQLILTLINRNTKTCNLFSASQKLTYTAFARLKTEICYVIYYNFAAHEAVWGIYRKILSQCPT